MYKVKVLKQSGCFLEWVKSLLHYATQACQTVFPKGSPRWHSSVCVRARVCVCFLFPCTRHRGSGVTWRLIPRGCHDNYSCQAVTRATSIILALWHQLVTPQNLWPLYKHSRAHRRDQRMRAARVCQVCERSWKDAVDWSHIFFSCFCECSSRLSFSSKRSQRPPECIQTGLSAERKFNF